MNQKTKDPTSHFMVDLETMGTGPNAAIIAIGAVRFNIETGEILNTFYTPVLLESSMAMGGVVDAGTILWWLGQSDEARAEFTKPSKSIVTALWEFRSFVQLNNAIGKQDVKLWGNGATFDNVILAQAYKRAEIEPPWSHRGDRCYRTMRNILPEVPDFEWDGVAHNALDDARNQARYLVTALKKSA